VWFRLAVEAADHFGFAAVAAVHQTTALNSMKIQHVLCILSDDDYQLYIERNGKEENY
jgi:hypothetical protein